MDGSGDKLFETPKEKLKISDFFQFKIKTLNLRMSGSNQNYLFSIRFQREYLSPLMRKLQNEEQTLFKTPVSKKSSKKTPRSENKKFLMSTPRNDVNNNKSRVHFDLSSIEPFSCLPKPKERPNQSQDDLYITADVSFFFI